MSVLVVLICFSLVLAAIFLGAFLCSVRSGQFDDTETPAMRMLFEDKVKNTETAAPQRDADSDSNQHQDMV